MKKIFTVVSVLFAFMLSVFRVEALTMIGYGSAGGGPTQEYRDPGSDVNVSGTWTESAGTRYTFVDDYEDTTPTDYITASTANATYVAGPTSAFSIPGGATNITVQVLYTCNNDQSGFSTVRAKIRIGTTNYNSVETGAHAFNSSTIQSYSDTYDTNPATTSAWTVSDINSGIAGFGVIANDATPAVNFSSIRMQVTYTAP